MIKKITLCFLVFSVAVFSSGANLLADADMEDDQTDIVTRVIDANTLLLKSGRQIRLIGVRAPSPYDDDWNRRLSRDTGLEEEKLGAAAQEAKGFVKYLVEGKRVRFELDPEQSQFEHRDREGRFFVYVWFTAPVFTEPPNWLVIDPEISASKFRYDGLLNACILRAGLASAETGWPFSFGGRFVALEAEAKENGRGLWKSPEAEMAEENQE